jgi:hypothetical protein
MFAGQIISAHVYLEQPGAKSEIFSYQNSHPYHIIFLVQCGRIVVCPIHLNNSAGHPIHHRSPQNNTIHSPSLHTSQVTTAQRSSIAFITARKRLALQLIEAHCSSSPLNTHNAAHRQTNHAVHDLAIVH